MEGHTYTTSIRHDDRQSTEPIVVLRKEKTELNILLKDLDTARAKWKPSGSFDQRYWAQAAKIEQISLDREEIKWKISYRSFVGTTAEWEDTQDAKSAADTIQAHKKAKEICQRRMKQLDEDKPCRSLMASFIKLFTTYNGHIWHCL
ncbi:hypothetical protein N7471_013091 [Penicillium samsonianum]|uniref:uncharacterized protein n=1 Tax=Penicillium samsonianum TaxID=1882272 RepID=UPI0025498E01|nr:uncharacterized protein N7471_013091 [Penicillium samsonianum]KAJ6118471.1 hypothetical protein N7471_013091 [Penicillium samsonianum]